MIWSIPIVQGFGNTYEEGWGDCQGNSRIHDLNTSHSQGPWTSSKRKQYTSLLSLVHIKFSAVKVSVFCSSAGTYRSISASSASISPASVIASLSNSTPLSAIYWSKSVLNSATSLRRTVNLLARPSYCGGGDSTWKRCDQIAQMLG